jgi:hypothetical protein
MIGLHVSGAISFGLAWPIFGAQSRSGRIPTRMRVIIGRFHRGQPFLNRPMVGPRQLAGSSRGVTPERGIYRLPQSRISPRTAASMFASSYGFGRKSALLGTSPSTG